MVSAKINMQESKEWEKTGIAYPMAGSIMEYV
jgi:hypothetical protein